MHRRAYLATLGSVVPLTLAGCSGTSADNSQGNNGTELVSSKSTTDISVTNSPAVESEMTEEQATTPESTATAVERTTAAMGGTPSNRLYDRTRVTFIDENETRLGIVRAWIADTAEKRYTGLSDTESLPNGTGMLFTYDEETKHTFVMRRMDYPIDIVFIGSDGRITAIESAPAPQPGENGNDIRRTGQGKYILEVPRGWMASHEISVGDRTNLGETGTLHTSTDSNDSSTIIRSHLEDSMGVSDSE